MAAKIFEVGDVLPQGIIRISWSNDISDFLVFYQEEYVEVTGSPYPVPLIGIGDKAYNHDNIYFSVRDENFAWVTIYWDGWQAPYTDSNGNHAYVDIDTSSWSLEQRTIVSVPSGLDCIYWELLPSGYSITYEENGGSTVTDLTGRTALPNPLPAPTKSGYTFLGWYYDSDFTNKAFADDPLTADVTLYAKWELTTYTITYNTNGGSSVPQTSNATQLPTPLPTTTKANHVFAGWYYDNLFTQKANAGDELTANVTLYAKWYTPTTWCEDIADAIREKEGSSGNIKHVDFPDRIRGLDTCIYLTQEEYDDITTPNENITYIIVEAE